jgi:isoquinoline 1-oxidoreductase alpha subunit
VRRVHGAHRRRRDAQLRAAVSSVEASAKVVTIEALSPTGAHPVQQAWRALDVPQCGYCQSGMIMAAASLLAQTPNPSDADIESAMTNICRCGTVQPRARGDQGGRARRRQGRGLNILHADGSTT